MNTRTLSAGTAKALVLALACLAFVAPMTPLSAEPVPAAPAAGEASSTASAAVEPSSASTAPAAVEPSSASTAPAALTSEALRLSRLPLAPPEAVLSSRLQPQKATIGDRITYELRVTAPADWSADLSAVGPVLQAAGFQILDYEKLRPERGEPGATVGLRFVISTYALGTYPIPAIPVGLRAKDGRWWRLDSRAVEVEVVPVERKPGEPDDIRDIKAPEREPAPFPGGWILVALAVAATAAGVIFLRGRGDEVEQIVITPLSAWEIALAELTRLDESGMREAHRLREWHYALSTIIRSYLARRFDLALMSDTSGELLDELHRAGEADGAEAILGEEGFRTLLEGFLAACDRVKFARHRPASDEVSALRAEADEILAASRPVARPVLDEDEEIVDEDDGEGGRP